MRYLLTFVAVLLCSVALSAQDYNGQVPDSTASIFNEETIQGLALLKTIMNDSPAYELYRTDNMWTFLKLETSTGKIWQVQYAVGDGDAFQVVLNDISLAFGGTEPAERGRAHGRHRWNGRVGLESQDRSS